jgi:hypothetical protein
VEDIVGFAEVLLPQASTSASHPTPFGVVVIRVSVDAFFFPSAPCPASPGWIVVESDYRG